MSAWNLKWMALEITSRCNLSCIHCRSSSSDQSSGGLFGIEEVKRLYRDIRQFASPVIVLSGGEPLVREDIFDIASTGTREGFRMALATNGSLIDDSSCLDIIRSGIKMVSLSLDGSSDVVHDDFRRQKGSFDAVINAADKFRKHGIKFIINSSFTKRNQSDIEKTYKLAKGLGATAWYMFLIVPTGRGEEIMNELVSKEDYEALLNWHYDMERNENDILVRPTCAPQYYRIWHERSAHEGLDTKRRSLSFSTGGGKGCIAGQSIIFINSMGDVYPCSYFPVSAGNVFKTPLEEIWNNSFVFESLRDFKSYEGKCGHCRYIGVCGGCRARSYAVTGSYLAEVPFCNYNKLNF